MNFLLMSLSKYRDLQYLVTKREASLMNIVVVILTRDFMKWQKQQADVFCKKAIFKGLQLYSKETPTQVFSCKIYEIFKINFFWILPPNGCF